MKNSYEAKNNLLNILVFTKEGFINEKMKFKDILELKMSILKLANNQNHKTLVIWATDCAQRVLPNFEDIHVNDNRPRKTIEADEPGFVEKLLCMMSV